MVNTGPLFLEINMIRSRDKFQMYITPRDSLELLSIINDYTLLSEEVIYRIKTGMFSETSKIKSTGIFLVDKEKGKISSMIFIYDEEEILADLETAIEYRNRGLASMLLETAISLGAKYLAVEDGNDIAITLYKEKGFMEYYYDEKAKIHYMSITGKAHPCDEENIISR